MHHSLRFSSWRDMRLFAVMVVVAIGLSLLQGCAGLQMPEKPQSFKETEIVTMLTAGEVVSQADILQTTGIIQPSDVRNLVKQTDEVRDGVLIARRLLPNDATGAAAKLDSVRKTIQALRDYLASRGGKFSSDAELATKARRQIASG